MHPPSPTLDRLTRYPLDGNVPIPCSVCGRTVHRWPPVCFCCRTTARQLGLPLVPVVILGDYRVGDADHRRLRGYKDGPSAEVRARYRGELVSCLAAWMTVHGGDLVDRTGNWSVVTAVPSTRRRGPSPAESLVDGVASLADRHLRLLGRGRGVVDHLQASRDGFAPLGGVDRAGLDGLPVLVFDDSITTGARAQSAAAVLRLAGARVVGILAIGRALAPVATTDC
jgi:predicted amidophosphoribosyltransferase